MSRSFPPATCKNCTRFIIALVALISLCALMASAQQQSPTNQQRPRRVTGSPAQPTASPGGTPSQSESEEVDEGDVVRVNTELVSVPAVVYDRGGRPMVSLRAENFVVYEDNQPQRITNFSTTEAPFEIALLLDTSGSTREDVDLIRRAAFDFINSLRANDRVAILAFNGEGTGPSQLAKVQIVSKLASNRAALRRAIASLGSSNGTPYYDSLVEIAEEIFHDSPAEEVQGRRAVVALTDGIDSASNSDYAGARSKLMHAGVACYFIEINTEDFVEDRLLRDCEDDGALRLSRTQLERFRRIFSPRADASDYADFCQLGQFERMQISRDLYDLARREMSDLAKTTGGRTFVAQDLRDARNAFAQVAAEIGTQYSLGYYPTNKSRDGRYRKIRVEIKGVTGGSTVRAREGYYAPSG
ncbi:MAG TPA: VWA domain-containing protein [Pyrinomonadaceae bacterium]|nr:VWA domain-containing protein [Pyrinomonadaceae bacterium]